MSRTKGEKFQIIGHRGAAALEPENTLRSFSRAVAEGVDGIEFDIQLLDGQLLVLHDETLDRTSNGKGSAGAYSFSALRELDFGYGQQIPLLKEAIESIPKTTLVNIELKGKCTGTETAIALKDHSERQFMVSSFRLAELQAFAAQQPILPNVNLAYLRLELADGTVDEAHRVGASSISLADWSVNADVIDMAQRAGFKVYVYTVNELERVQSLKDMGAAGVFTDAPDRIKHEFLV